MILHNLFLSVGLSLYFPCMVSKQEIKTDIYLFSAAMLWGLGFVAQRQGMEYLGPFSYSALRFSLGTLVVLIFYVFQKKNTRIHAKLKDVLKSGLIIGILLFAAVNTQQIGLKTTEAGKAGFITSLYMVFVPVFGIFLGRRVRLSVLTGIALALSGLYFMSVRGAFVIETGDLLIFICSILWAIHFLFIAHYTKKVDAVLLSICQFAVCSLLSILAALFTESINMESFVSSIPAVLYGGIGSVGIAYTLHVVALKTSEPAYASLILSMESVFGALGGRIILGEAMSQRELFGAALILSGVAFAQIRQRKRK